MIAPWNSSSRGPVGLVRTVSTTPKAAARDTAGIWSPRRPHSSNSTQRVVRDTFRTPARTSTPSETPCAKSASTIATAPPAATISVSRDDGAVTARHDLQPIVPPIPIQLVTKPRSLRTVLRNDQDHRLHDCGVVRRRVPGRSLGRQLAAGRPPRWVCASGPTEGNGRATDTGSQDDQPNGTVRAADGQAVTSPRHPSLPAPHDRFHRSPRW